MKRQLFAAAAGLALALPALPAAAPAQADATRACTEAADYSMTHGGATETINVYDNTCDDWIQARLVCQGVGPVFSYYYGGWVNDSTGQQSTASAPGGNCPTVSGSQGFPEKAGFVYSKTGRNDVNCWNFGDHSSGSCSS